MSTRYQSLDFLRAIAIALVILAHAVLSYGAPEYLAPLQLGGTGVDLFFVLSGWLLGGQLFKEVNSSHTVNMKKFWVRRWMRTLPAYYAILLLSVAQRYLTKDDVEFPWPYFVFLQNYFFPLEFFTISWSLCVEEQFYLAIAPLVAFSRYLSKNTTTCLLLLFMLLPAAFRAAGWYDVIEETHVRFDGCVCGVLLAQLRHQQPQFWSRLCSVAAPFAAVSLVLYVAFYYERYSPGIFFRNPDKLVLALLFGSWVLLAASGSRFARILYFPGANYIATRSYSMYLMHPEVLALLRRVSDVLPFYVYLAASFAGSIICAELLFRFVEKPFMDMRERYAVSRSSQ